MPKRSLSILASKLKDPRLAFLFNPDQWLPSLDGTTAKDIDSLLEDWIGGPSAITILDLSGIPSSILNDLIGALLRILYDSIFWARDLPEGGRERPLLIVLEEAHAYLAKENSGSAAVAVRRIAKEGRKYGVGMMIVSQRPSEIDTTILSQCGTIFAMRLANDTDRGHIAGAASDNLKGLFDMLPVLRTGEAIVVGQAVSLPVRTLITHHRSIDALIALTQRWQSVDQWTAFTALAVGINPETRQITLRWCDSGERKRLTTHISRSSQKLQSYPRNKRSQLWIGLMPTRQISSASHTTRYRGY